MGLFFHFKEKTWTAPSAIFLYFWAVVTFVYSLRLFGLYDVSLNTWIVIVLGTVAFVAGSNLRVTMNKQYMYVPKNQSDHNHFISKKVFWILMIIVLIITVKNLAVSITLMNQGYRMDVIRQAYFGNQEIQGYTHSSSSISVLLNYFKDALQTILVAVGIEYFFTDTKKNLGYLLVVLFLVFADAFSNGGRWGITYVALEIFVCYGIMKKKNSVSNTLHISKKVKLLLVILIIGIIVGIINVTESRLGGNYIEHFYIYLCGCIPLLNVNLQYIEANQILTFFMSGQFGGWSLFLPYLQKAIHYDSSIYWDSFNIISNAQNYKGISPTQNYNAFTSCFYYLYADMRWGGVVIGMFVFGVLAGTLFKSTMSKRKYCYVAPYLIISQMILKTIQTFPLTSNVYVITFMLIVVFYRIQTKKVRVK